MRKRILAWILALLMALSAVYAEVLVDEGIALHEDWIVEYGEIYVVPEEVALYLHAFCELPPNYLTKSEARALGWVSNKGNLWDVTDHGVIGGDVFGNREGLLPKAKGRVWYECDVNYEGGYRGEERLLFATDGLIYYTDDHYESFELWYEGWFDDDCTYQPRKDGE